MLSGSAMARVAVLLVSAGLIAGLIQYFWPARAPVPAPQPPAQADLLRETLSAAPPPAQPREPVRTVPGAPVPPPSAPPERQPPAEAPPPPPPPLADTPPPPPSAPPVATDPAERAQEDAPPRALSLVDLNTATLAQLNGLRGGGSIGRAIIQRRPYASVDQLLSKRVLSRATYEKIKDQVTVQ